MRKFFAALIIFVLSSCASFAGQVNPDMEIHKTVGGLYALVSALSVSPSVPEKVEGLRKFFADVPMSWPDDFMLEKVENAVWVGISVEKSQTSKTFLRSHSSGLKISDMPGGDSWVSGKFAWLKAGEINGGKFEPVELRASYGDGKESASVFFSTKGQDFWWRGYPELSKQATAHVMKIWGVSEKGLHFPKGSARSIYDEVRPSAVRKPADMHTKSEKTFQDSLGSEVGDVIFSPVPKISNSESF